MTVFVPAEILEQIRVHAAAAEPEECCGLLAGRIETGGDCRIWELRASANVALDDRRRRFEIDPQVRFDLMRTCDAAGDGRAVVGHYHSHPGHPAEPSKSDLEAAHEPDMIWLIYGAGGGGDAPTVIRAFKARADRSAFDPLELLEIP